MREGITTTLSFFRPYGIRATYYAAGYTLLLSNTTRTRWMGDPTYAWATTRNRWTSNHWQTTPWFAPDPYGTAQSHPAWYAGDLVPLILREGHDIQSHTFSHFYGGFVRAQDWHDDLATWDQVAAARGVPPPRSLAFPWSSSGGMSDASWDALEAAGIRSVTRLSDQSQYNLFPINERGVVAAPRCQPLPGHERILACPDVYLTPASVDQVLATIDHTREVGGAMDVWSHTEEVTTEEQQAAWERVVRYAATQADIWIAPLREIADWQQALEEVHIRTDINPHPSPDSEEDAFTVTVTVTNHSDHDLEGLTLRSNVPVGPCMRETPDGLPLKMSTPHELLITVRAGQTREVQLCSTS
ncbi:MAG: polysaccharide deacetylase family protein [Chloroflexaceae bacterium]|nr:polysaccharide deacetylase family protein [Chloroflexaceae bacterium]